jgi:uncharacterized protein YecT (DUF1311 family)
VNCNNLLSYFPSSLTRRGIRDTYCATARNLAKSANFLAITIEAWHHHYSSQKNLKILKSARFIFELKKLKFIKVNMRYIKRILILAILTALNIYAHADGKKTANSQNKSPCLTQSGSVETGQCAEERFQAIEKQLGLSYQDALEKLPETDSSDDRKTKDQLKKAQNAWKIYRSENCNYIGGIEGGSSLWISIFSTECAIEETKKRIEFFKNLPMAG